MPRERDENTLNLERAGSYTMATNHAEGRCELYTMPIYSCSGTTML